MKNVALLQGSTAIPFVKVLRHGQVTVPRIFRNFLGIQEGDVLEVKVEKNGVFFKPKILTDKTLVAKEDLTKEKEWSALAATSFAQDWENKQDSIYDNWKQYYNLPKR